MSYVFISHVEEDAATARELAGGLEEAGYTAWFYERDSLPGPPYVTQILQAIGQSTVMIVLVSPATLGSWQVDREIFQAFETEKHMIPLLIGITYQELRNRRKEWVLMFGAATSLSIPSGGVSAIMPRLIQGLKGMGVEPTAPAHTTAAAPTPVPAVTTGPPAAQDTHTPQPDTQTPPTPVPGPRSQTPRYLLIGNAAVFVLLVGSILIWKLMPSPRPSRPPPQVSTLYTTTLESYHRFASGAHAALPRVGTFPAHTADVAYSFEHSGGGSGSIPIQVYIRDHRGVIVASAVVRPPLNLSAKAYAGHLPAPRAGGYPAGTYTPSLLSHGPLARSTPFTVAPPVHIGTFRVQGSPRGVRVSVSYARISAPSPFEIAIRDHK